MEPVSVTVEKGSSLTFDRFWAWLQDHPNCILEAGTTECYLFDHVDHHWHLGEDEDQKPYVQLVRGKQLVGELLLEGADVFYVQARPEALPEEPERFVFELVGGVAEEPYVLYRFLMAHGIEAESSHQGVLKH
jgi:hypothetical protein